MLRVRDASIRRGGDDKERDGRAKGVENEEEDETGELQPADGKPRALETEEEDEHEL